MSSESLGSPLDSFFLALQKMNPEESVNHAMLDKDKYVYYMCFLLDPAYRELSILSQPEFSELRAALPDPPFTPEQEFVQHVFPHHPEKMIGGGKKSDSSEVQKSLGPVLQPSEGEPVENQSNDESNEEKEEDDEPVENQPNEEKEEDDEPVDKSNDEPNEEKEEDDEPVENQSNDEPDEEKEEDDEPVENQPKDEPNDEKEEDDEPVENQPKDEKAQLDQKTEHLSVEELRTRLLQHFPIQTFLDTLAQHDLTLAELYIQDNYWLQSHPCQSKGCQELSLENLNHGPFLCDAMHTQRDHHCVKNVRSLLEDMIRESLAKKKIELVQQHVATKEEIDGYLARISSVNEFQQLPKEDQEQFLSFFRNQPPLEDAIHDVFYNDDDHDDENVNDNDNDNDNTPHEDDETKTGGGNNNNKKPRTTPKTCARRSDDDVIVDKVLPLMIRYMSTLTVPLGLTARQVMRGTNHTPHWKERVFPRKSSIHRTGGSTKRAATKVEEAMEKLHDERWWSKQQTKELLQLKSQVEFKLQSCHASSSTEEGGAVTTRSRRNFTTTAAKEEEDDNNNNSNNNDECDDHLLEVLERVEAELLTKSIYKNEHQMKADAEREEDLVEHVLEEQEHEKEHHHNHSEISDLRDAIARTKVTLQHVRNEIILYESEKGPDSTTLLQGARSEERETRTALENLQTSLAQKEKVAKSPSSSKSTTTEQEDKFKKILSDELDVRIGEHHGVVMTMYLQVIVLVRRQIREVVEKIMPHDARDKHKENKFDILSYDSNRAWTGEQGYLTKNWKATTSTVAVGTHNVTLKSIDAIYLIFKNQYVLTAVLFALQKVKRRMCRRIQQLMFLTNVDAKPLNQKEVVQELITTFRLYFPTHIIPQGQKIIRDGLESVKLGLNMMNLANFGIVGNAINAVILFIVCASEDAFEEMCSANFLMTTATQLVDILDWFHCFTESATHKLNQSIFGNMDIFHVWNMDNYKIELHVLKDTGQGYNLGRDVYVEDWDYKNLEAKMHHHSTTGTMFTYYPPKKEDRKQWEARVFRVHGNDYAAYALCNGHTTFVKNENNERDTKITKTLGTFSLSKSRYDDIYAYPANLDMLSILLADKALTVDQIQPPGLRFPIGHWSQSAIRKQQDKTHNRLLTDIYPANDKPFDFYASSPTDKEEREKFEIFQSYFPGKSAEEARTRTLSKKYIKNYTGSGIVFRFSSRHGLVFANSSYAFKTANELKEQEEEINNPTTTLLADADENEPASKKKKIEGGGGTTLSLRKYTNNSNNNNKTKKNQLTSS